MEFAGCIIFFIYSIIIYIYLSTRLIKPNFSVINDYCEPTPRKAWNDLHDIKVVYLAPVKGSKSAIQ